MWETLVNGVIKLIEVLYMLTVKIGIPSYALVILILTILIKLLCIL